MTTGQFSPDEWKSLLNAPHWVYAALIAAERGNIFTRRTEARALDKFLSGYVTQSPLVKEIIAGQNDADDKLEGSLQDAERMLGQVGTLLESQVGVEEGDAVRDFLMNAGKTIAEATHEDVRAGQSSITAKENEALTLVETALKATEADKRRRQEAAAQAERLAEQAREAEARAAAERQRQEAARAEAQRQAAEAEAKRIAAEAEAKKKAAEAETQKQAAQAEAQKQAAQAEAQKQAAEAEAQKPAAEAEAQKPAAEAAAAPAETMRIYVVKPGDTLSGIAQQMYGKAGRWPEIYEANRDRIKKPNLIRPGWKLRIPD
jgi:nucleoid-associated protein YgaU